MRIERTSRWPTVPWWSVGIVAAYLLLVGAYVWVEHAAAVNAPPMCLFRRTTGYPCPSCGTTHMVLAIAEGNLRQAATHNPLMFCLVGFVIVLLVLRIGFRRRIVFITSASARRIWSAVIVVAVLANWLYLMISPSVAVS